MGTDRAAKQMAFICTVFGFIFILVGVLGLVYYVVEGYMPSGVIEPLVSGVVVFLIGLVLIRYNNKRRWGLGPPPTYQ